MTQRLKSRKASLAPLKQFTLREATHSTRPKLVPPRPHLKEPSHLPLVLVKAPAPLNITMLAPSFQQIPLARTQMMSRLQQNLQRDRRVNRVIIPKFRGKHDGIVILNAGSTTVALSQTKPLQTFVRVLSASDIVSHQMSLFDSRQLLCGHLLLLRGDPVILSWFGTLCLRADQMHRAADNSRAKASSLKSYSLFLQS